MAEQYLIMNNDLYYGPNSQGYTGIRDKAGRYSFAEACKIDNPEAGVLAIPLEDAPEFTKACFDDLARDHLIKVRNEHAERIEELEKEMHQIRLAVGSGAKAWAVWNSCNGVFTCGVTNRKAEAEKIKGDDEVVPVKVYVEPSEEWCMRDWIEEQYVTKGGY